MEMIKGFIVVWPFYHDNKHHYKGDKVDFGKFDNQKLEISGLIRWAERPEIVMPKDVKKPIVLKKTKKNVRKGKGKV